MPHPADCMEEDIWFSASAMNIMIFCNSQVTLQGESFTKTGIDNWTVSYKYKTDSDTLFPLHIEHCTCQVNLSLIIVVDGE